jgi:hypothetical protein
MANLKIETFINTITGEVYYERKKYITSAWHEEKGYRLSSRDTMDIPFPSISTIYLGYYSIISRYTQKHTNILSYRGNKNAYKPMQAEQIGKRLKIGRSTAYRFLDHCIERELIARDATLIGDQERICYIMNPIYFLNSKYISLELYLKFKDQLDPILPAWVIDRYINMMKER